ncbi:carbon-monoxide dehydrogenase medium subunit [Nitrobacteraceae bacterium AZCC 2161]
MSHLVIHRSRSRIPDFSIMRPRSLIEARNMLDGEPDAVAMAGGLDIVNRMKEGFAPRSLVMLAGIDKFDAVRLSSEQDAIDIGAGTSHDALANNELVRARLPDLAQCWGQIANIRIRMQGTVAGNLLALMPGYEGAILLSALDASLLYSTNEIPDGSIDVKEFGAASDAFVLSRGLVGTVRVPLPTAGTTRRLAYDRSLRPMLSVALSIDHTEGLVDRACVVVGGCHRWPFCSDLPVVGLSLSDFHAVAEDMALQAIGQMPEPTIPWFGLSGYRETVAPVLLSRLIREVAQ